MLLNKLNYYVVMLIGWNSGVFGIWGDWEVAAPIVEEESSLRSQYQRPAQTPIAITATPAVVAAVIPKRPDLAAVDRPKILYCLMACPKKLFAAFDEFPPIIPEIIKIWLFNISGMTQYLSSSRLNICRKW